MANIIEMVNSLGNFKNLARAIHQSGMADTLSEPGPFTLFAPIDEAFARLPSGMFDKFIQNKEQIRSLLSYHVVSGRFLSKDFKGSIDPKTLMGETLPIRRTEGRVMLGDAKITQTDINANNGVIHAIDGIVMPKLLKQKVA